MKILLDELSHNKPIHSCLGLQNDSHKIENDFNQLSNRLKGSVTLQVQICNYQIMQHIV